MNKKVVYIGLGAVALILLASKSASASPLPDGATFNLPDLIGTYNASDVQRLQNLYYVIANKTDPNTGQPLSSTQLGLMLSQALFESGLFTGQANYNLMDNFHNYTGIKGNSRYAAAPGSSYVAYPSLDAYADDWMTILNFGNPPIEATSPADFAARLKANGYYTDNQSTYTNGIQTYYNLLSSVAV